MNPYTRSNEMEPNHPSETLFRSETMHLYQFIVRSEAAFDCVVELGKVGSVQFRDVSSGKNACMIDNITS